jgi:hypothetical protein
LKGHSQRDNTTTPVCHWLRRRTSRHLRHAIEHCRTPHNLPCPHDPAPTWIQRRKNTTTTSRPETKELGKPRSAVDWLHPRHHKALPSATAPRRCLLQGSVVGAPPSPAPTGARISPGGWVEEGELTATPPMEIAVPKGITDAGANQQARAEHLPRVRCTPSPREREDPKPTTTLHWPYQTWEHTRREQRLDPLPG